MEAHTSGGHGDAERRADQEQNLPSFLAGPVRHVGFATPWPTVTQATVVQNSKMAQIRCKLSIIGPTRVAGRSGQQGPGAECPPEPLPSPPRVPSKAGFRPLRLPGADRFIGPANGLRVEQQGRQRHGPGQQGKNNQIYHALPPVRLGSLRRPDDPSGGGVQHLVEGKPFRLKPPHAVEQAALPAQLRDRAVLDDPAVQHDEDPVEGGQRR